MPCVVPTINLFSIQEIGHPKSRVALAFGKAFSRCSSVQLLPHSARADNPHIHSLRPIRLIFTAPIDVSARRCERIRTLNPLRAEALRDLAIGIDASLSGEIDGPECSVSFAGPRGP